MDFEFIAFRKHTPLVWMTAGLYQLGGFRLLVLVQTLSTLAAAVASARIVARTRPSMATHTLWFAGLVSPLFFDGFLGYAHAFAAALLIWAGVLALEFVDPRSGGAAPDGRKLAAAAALVALACMTRTEAVLGGLALSAGLLAAGLGRRPRARWNVAFIVVAFTSAAAVVFNYILRPTTVGLANPNHIGAPWGGVMGRIEGIQRTWLSPGQYSADVVFLFIAVAVIGTGWLVRTRSQAKLATAVLATTLALALTRAWMPQPVLIFGLVMASPLLILGFARGLPLARQNSETTLCAVTFAAYAMAVAATQYRYGGVAEWGGRYFAAGLPYAVSVAVPGLGQIQAPFTGQQRRRIVALAMATALVVNLAGVRSLADSRARTADLTNEIAAAMAETEVRGHGRSGSRSLAFRSDQRERPIVITTVPALGRLTWNIIDDGAWLLVDEGKLAPTADRLHELGVHRFVLVTADPEAELAEIGRRYKVETWDETTRVPLEVIIVTSIG